MSWILCGKGTAAADCLDLLVDGGNDVWAIGVQGDPGRDSWQRSFKAAARRRGVPFDQPRRINDREFVKSLSSFGADILLSIQYDQILRRDLLRSVEAPCLNLHFSLLPRHRGVDPIAWALLSGDSEAGVTLHYMVEDIDAGDIIAQRSVPTEPSETTARELYDRVSTAAVALFTDCLPFDQTLLSQRRRQDPALASYHRKEDLDFSERRIEWKRNEPELHAWLRAMIFPPFQYPETELGGRLLAVTNVGPKHRGQVTALPGEVVRICDEGVKVATDHGAIWIRGLTDLADPMLDSQAIFSEINVGDRFS